MTDIQHFHSFLDGLPEAWQQFVSQTAQTFDQTAPWFVEFERHLLAPGERLHIVTAADANGTPLALLPLRSARVTVAGPIAAQGLTALSNYYTALFGPLAAADCDPQVARELARGALETGSSRNVIDLNPLADNDHFPAEMAREWQRRGYGIERYFRFGNWYLDVAGRSSSEYFRSLPGQLRSTLERKGKKLRARADVSIRIVTEAADVPAAMDAYEHVYRSSWKTDEPYKDFIRAVVTEFARRNWLRLGLVEIGSRPAAAQIWFVYRGTASIFKLAYDEEFGNLSVGSALTQELMRRVIDVDAVTVVDYLCGDDAYKRDWMSARRERIGIRAVRRLSWPGSIYAASGVIRRLTRRTGVAAEPS